MIIAFVWLWYCGFVSVIDVVFCMRSCVCVFIRYCASVCVDVVLCVCVLSLLLLLVLFARLCFVSNVYFVRLRVCVCVCV